jgi:hypothetical protein
MHSKPALIFQIRIVLSTDPDTTLEPSRVKATDKTGWAWPRAAGKTPTPVFEFLTLIVVPQEPADEFDNILVPLELISGNLQTD